MAIRDDAAILAAELETDLLAWAFRRVWNGRGRRSEFYGYFRAVCHEVAFRWLRGDIESPLAADVDDEARRWLIAVEESR